MRWGHHTGPSHPSTLSAHCLHRCCRQRLPPSACSTFCACMASSMAAAPVAAANARQMPGASTSYAPSVTYVASRRLQARRALLHQEAPWCPPSQPQQRPSSRRRGAPAQAAEGTLLGGVTAPAARQLRIPVGDREVSAGSGGRRRGLMEAPSLQPSTIPTVFHTYHPARIALTAGPACRPPADHSRIGGDWAAGRRRGDGHRRRDGENPLWPLLPGMLHPTQP
jgi:hypothetical protein